MSSESVRRVPPPVLSPALRTLLAFVLTLFGLLCVNSLYLVSVTIAESAGGVTYQNYFYLVMFLGHLVLGLILVVPALYVYFDSLAAWGRKVMRTARRTGVAHAR